MSSRDYYRSGRDSLPPIRDVLGDQLDFPPQQDSPYSFDAVNRALPTTSGSSRARSTWPQSGPTLPPIHSSRSHHTAPGTPSYAGSPQQYPQHSSSSRSSHAHPASHGQPQAHGLSSGPTVPYSFDVFRPSSSGLVHASSSSRSQGILRSTRSDAGKKHSSNYHEDEEEEEDSSKRYACQHCGKRFGRPSSLRTHEIVHSDERPFECSYPGCGKTFTVASNMRRHFRKMHEASSGGGHSDDEGEDSHQQQRHAGSSSGYYSSSRR